MWINVKQNTQLFAQNVFYNAHAFPRSVYRIEYGKVVKELSGEEIESLKCKIQQQGFQAAVRLFRAITEQCFKMRFDIVLPT